MASLHTPYLLPYYYCWRGGHSLLNPWESPHSVVLFPKHGHKLEKRSRISRMVAEKGASAEEQSEALLSSKQQQQQEMQRSGYGRKARESRPLKSNEPCCYGCGAPLQTFEAEAPGYIPLQTYELKKKHHQLNRLLCGRCQLLTHGQMIPAVGGHGGYNHGKQFVLAEELREHLSYIRHQKVLIIKLVDIVDFNGSFLTRIRDLVGANPIILVATKVDLLPRGTDLKAVGDWLVEQTIRKKLNVLSVHLTSSKSLIGVSGVIHDMQQCRKGRSVYILGSANVGKSAFVSALLQTMAQRDPFAAAAKRHRPVQSAMPGTTLGSIKINAFSSGGSLYDTPGVHLHHRMAAMLAPEDVIFLSPQRRLRGRIVTPDRCNEQSRTKVLDGQRKEQNNSTETVDEWLLQGNSGLRSNLEGDKIDLPECIATSGNLSGLSIFWGGIARFDVVKAPAYLRLRFYGSSTIPIITSPTVEADSFYKEGLGRILIPPGEDAAISWPGLFSNHVIKLTLECSKRPASDIAISGLGWVTVETVDTFEKVEEMKVSHVIDKEMVINVHLPRSVEVFVRPPIPVGPYGFEWYEYSEVTKEEQERRPVLSI